MSMTDRDKKRLLAIVPVILIVAYWFLLLAPKREEAATSKIERTKQEERLASARATVEQATGDKTKFTAAYGEIVRLGKAIPARVDMPSLLVQLDRAAEGTGISFTKISTGERTPVAPPATAGSEAPATPGAPPAAAGGTPAQSAPGSSAEAANNAAANANNASSAAEQSGVNPADAQTSTSSGGGIPVGGGAATPGAPEAAPVATGGLETVPLELEFIGNFFRLADFFHDIKRFVHVVNNDVVVNGRLVTIDGVNFTSETTIFPRIRATLTATVYLSPLTQGATAGATPTGPAPTTPAAAPAPPSGGSTPAATPAPTAAATP